MQQSQFLKWFDMAPSFLKKFSKNSQLMNW